MGRRKFYRGRGGWKGGKLYLGVELITCIDSNEGEALRRGPTFNPGVWRPLYPSVPPPMGAGGEREGGGREDIGTTETHAHVTSHFR